MYYDAQSGDKKDVFFGMESKKASKKYPLDIRLWDCEL
jgi:hypothetical protein